MKTTQSIFEKAHERATEMGLPYQGALLPQEAYQVLQGSEQAKLVDVRTRAELDWVGRMPDAIEIELRSYPGMLPNPEFVAQLSRQVDKNHPVLFVCRSGARSSQAAAMAASAGFAACYNILEGFEGDKDAQGHRGGVGGWKAAGLPWEQS